MVMASIQGVVEERVQSRGKSKADTRDFPKQLLNYQRTRILFNK